MDKIYRVEQVIEGRKNPIVRGYYCATIDCIKRAIEHRVIGGGVINIYTKTGKRVLASFEG